MLKKNEQLKKGIMTALVVFGAIMAIAVVVSPLVDIITHANAFRDQRNNPLPPGPGRTWNCAGNGGFGC